MSIVAKMGILKDVPSLVYLNEKNRSVRYELLKESFRSEWHRWDEESGYNMRELD